MCIHNILRKRRLKSHLCIVVNFYLLTLTICRMSDNMQSMPKPAGSARKISTKTHFRTKKPHCSFSDTADEAFKSSSHSPMGFALSQASQSVAIFYNRKEILQQNNVQMIPATYNNTHNCYMQKRVINNMLRHVARQQPPLPRSFKVTVDKQWLALR